MSIALLLLTAIEPREIVQHVDRLELNHVYSQSGRLAIDQIILWDWDTLEERYQVVDWMKVHGYRLEVDGERMEWERRHPNGPDYIPRPNSSYMVPRRDGGKYSVTWWDSSLRTVRSIEAKRFIETWTGFDREVEERKVLPQSKRRKLSPPIRGYVP